MDLNKYMKSHTMHYPLEPREAFYGGRTEAFTMYKEAAKDESINYYDVTSLYPFINKTGKIPLGHPLIITENFKNIDAYEGLVKCKINPPRNLYLPVLPSRIKGKLMFGLCRTCMEDGVTENCCHNVDSRALTGTWVSDEIKKAVEKGYEIEEIYEVWHFENVSQYDPLLRQGGVFTEYVNTFLKIKQEASGWPDCFWGKFGQRLNLPRTTYLTDPSIYFDILTSDSQEVQDVSFVTDDMVRINWINQSQFIEETGRTNVVIAAYTTTQARLQLYKYLENLGDRALYCDTDSIIFSSKPGDWRPITGDYLGDLTDETPNNNIDVFVSGGPKNYGYKLKNPDRDGNRTCCKIRGITLNYKNALELNFDTMKDVVQGKTDKITVTDDNKICREVKTTNIITRAEDKTYKIVFDKRVLKKDYTTTPYGM
ncbi:Hypothetical predicted protein [Mytilus galloprovincialis]|uniref:DNA-directed DNA polymerase n=1 Tax=Mytilus galloprovincialis TaxID=29158 RepID=A0A8B6BHX1_MYTGA|nr:Hypothetical predicted protein [Mytilus galloprovincialis]